MDQEAEKIRNNFSSAMQHIKRVAQDVTEAAHKLGRLYIIMQMQLGVILRVIAYFLLSKALWRNSSIIDISFPVKLIGSSEKRKQ